MKVLFFSHQSGFIYGGEVSTLAFMKVLGELGVEVHLACPPGIFADRAAAVARIHLVPAVQFSRSFRHLPFLLRSLRGTHKALARIVREEKIDLVHGMSLKAMAYISFLRKVPKVWHHHDILPAGTRNRAWLRTFAGRAKVILVPSAASRDALVASGVKAQKIEILYNGLDAKDWRARAKRGDGEPFVFGFVGELSERKGIDRLPELIAAMDSAGFGAVKWKIAGGELSSPEFARSLRESLSTQVASGEVEFLGRREDIGALLQGFDALWVPSRQEPFGIVLIEAAFSGVPVVAAPVGGIPEIVGDGQTGFLAGTLPEMVRAFMELKNPDRWNKISVRARTRAVERFGMRALGEKLKSIYEGALR